MTFAVVVVAVPAVQIKFRLLETLAFNFRSGKASKLTTAFCPSRISSLSTWLEVDWTCMLLVSTICMKGWPGAI